MTTSTPRLRRLLSGSGGIVIAVGVMNAASYIFTVVAARLLGPRDYGAFAAIMGLLLVLGVLQLGLQTTGARRIASAPAKVGEIEQSLLAVTYRVALGLALVCLLLSPAISAMLSLNSIAVAVLIAVSVWPMTVMGGQAGVLQGERRWFALSLVYLVAGLSRVVIGTLLLLWRPSEAMAVLAVAVSFLAPVAIGWIALRRSAVHRKHSSPDGHDARSMWWEVLHNSHALVAFLALANADVIAARSLFDPHDAGLYAAGVILAKAVLFLPQFVVVIAFPEMSTEKSRRRAVISGVGVVAVLGLVSTAATWALSGLALIFVGGDEYAAIRDQLWAFALLGTVLSMIQILVYSVVANQHRRTVGAIWLALALVIAGALRADTVTELLLTVLVIDSALCLLLLVLVLVRTQAPAAPSGPADSVGGVVPAASGADGDVQRDGQVGGGRHLLADE